MALIFAAVATVAEAQGGQDEAGCPFQAPVVSLDANGLFTVGDCPMELDGLLVKPDVGESAINRAFVVRDGVLFQYIPIDEDDFIVHQQVHYLDANFDGNVDFLIGPGTNREYSALFLWNVEEQAFVRATVDGLSVFNGDFFYEPERMAVYRRTSSSAVETTYTMMTWQGSDLQSEETFIIVSDEASRSACGVKHHYTVRNYYSDEDIISTDDPSRFEGTWSEWAIALTEH